MAKAVGDDTTVAFGTLTIDATDIKINGISVNIIEQAYLNSTSVTKIPSKVKNAGDVTITGAFDPTSAVPVGTTETLTITWSDDTVWTVSASLQSWGGGVSKDADGSTDFTFACSGDWDTGGE